MGDALMPNAPAAIERTVSRLAVMASIPKTTTVVNTNSQRTRCARLR
ncbi:MAG: hypothetical protein HND48_24040 [Chloroflexi bacterium]|nr:hypothetical protein [Chloroflexota bacterium]